MYNFYAFLDRMKYIKRWSLMRSTREENIMEHSQQVAIIAHALAAIDTEIYKNSPDIQKTVFYALYHEVSEVMTGDLPTPIKYFNQEIHGAYKQLEDKAEDKLLDMLPAELKPCFAPFIKADDNSYEYKERIYYSLKIYFYKQKMHKQGFALRQKYIYIEYYMLVQ